MVSDLCFDPAQTIGGECQWCSFKYVVFVFELMLGWSGVDVRAGVTYGVILYLIHILYTIHKLLLYIIHILYIIILLYYTYTYLCSILLFQSYSPLHLPSPHLPIPPSPSLPNHPSPNLLPILTPPSISNIQSIRVGIWISLFIFLPGFKSSAGGWFGLYFVLVWCLCYYIIILYYYILYI